MTAYTLPLNRGLALAFLTFADARIRLGRPVEKGELGLNNSQYGNFQNLRHFGIVTQLEKGKGWEFTPAGLKFLQGGQILSPVAHMGGKTLEPDHLAWSTHNGPKPAPIRILDILPEEWKQREEFKAEKSDAVA